MQLPEGEGHAPLSGEPWPAHLVRVRVGVRVRVRVRIRVRVRVRLALARRRGPEQRQAAGGVRVKG